MKKKKLLAVALSAAFLIGGGSKALDLAIPTAYAEESKEELNTQLEQKKTEKAGLEAEIKTSNEKADELEKKAADETISEDQKQNLTKEAEELRAKVKENQAKVDALNAEITKLEERIKALADSEKVVTKYVDEEGNNLAPEQEGKQAKIEIDKYEWIKTTTDEKGNTTHVYKLKQRWLATSFQIHTLEGKWVNVAGAVIEVKNENGELVHTFTTNDSRVDVKLPVGKYTLTVVSVPVDEEIYEWKESKTQVVNNGPAFGPFHMEERPLTYYKDTEDKDLADPERGQKEPKDIEGYVLKDKKEARNGCIKYIYEKAPKVEIETRFVDTEGKEIAKTVKGKKEKIDIEGYTFKETKKDEKGNIIHIYTKNPKIDPDDDYTPIIPGDDEDSDIEDDKDQETSDKDKEDEKDPTDSDKKDEKDPADVDKEDDKKPDDKPNTDKDEKLSDKDKDKQKENSEKPEKSKVAPTKKGMNPKTGVAGASLLVGTLLASTAAVAATKKNNK